MNILDFSGKSIKIFIENKHKQGKELTIKDFVNFSKLINEAKIKDTSFKTYYLITELLENEIENNSLFGGNVYLANNILTANSPDNVATTATTITQDNQNNIENAILFDAFISNNVLVLYFNYNKLFMFLNKLIGGVEGIYREKENEVVLLLSDNYSYDFLDKKFQEELEKKIIDNLKTNLILLKKLDNSLDIKSRLSKITNFLNIAFYSDDDNKRKLKIIFNHAIVFFRS